MQQRRNIYAVEGDGRKTGEVPIYSDEQRDVRTLFLKKLRRIVCRLDSPPISLDLGADENVINSHRHTGRRDVSWRLRFHPHRRSYDMSAIDCGGNTSILLAKKHNSSSTMTPSCLLISLAPPCGDNVCRCGITVVGCRL